eukprot:scaffold3345_cov109-Alexandrium_tamarense.AAC.2
MGSARWEYFGSPFQDLLQRTYPDILAFHGDGHEFSLERVDRDNANLFDLECDGGMDADPLLISITRQGSNRDGLTEEGGSDGSLLEWGGCDWREETRIDGDGENEMMGCVGGDRC